MIDLHAHLLPGIDDGPADVAGAVALAEAAVAAGVTAMAATPHIDHLHGVDPRSLASRRETLSLELAAMGLPLEVLQGGELTAARLVELDPADLALLTLGGGRYLLLECPFAPTGQMFEHTVARAQSLGFDVLLGHPERSPEFIGRPERLAALVRQGVLVQVTAGSLLGAYGRTVQESAISMFEDGLVHVVASDAHEADTRRPEAPDTVFAPLERRLPGVSEHARYWTVDVPALVLSGGEVPPPPPVRRATRFSRLAAKLRR